METAPLVFRWSRGMPTAWVETVPLVDPVVGKLGDGSLVDPAVPGGGVASEGIVAGLGGSGRRSGRQIGNGQDPAPAGLTRSRPRDGVNRQACFRGMDHPSFPIPAHGGMQTPIKRIMGSDRRSTGPKIKFEAQGRAASPRTRGTWEISQP